MKNFETMIAPALMALFAMPAMCQGAGAGKPAFADQDILATLVSADATTVVFKGMRLLDTTIVLTGRRDQGRAAVPQNLVGSADIYWQYIGFDETGGVCTSDIQRRPRQTQDQSDLPQDVQDMVPTDAVPAFKSFSDDQAARSDADGSAASALPMSLQLVTEQGGKTQLQVAFDAPSNDYRLALVDVVRGHDGAGTDVYLYRKLPGKGEGEQDVVEHHSLTIDLLERCTVRVFLAEGTASRPSSPIIWHALAKLQ